MSTQHTPGRLRIVLDGTCSGTWPHLIDEDENTVAECAVSHVETAIAASDQGPIGNYTEFPERFKIDGDSGLRSLEDARRLVACWNACEMVSTEDLEALTRPGDVSWACTIDRVVRERDKLLAAIGACRDAMPETAVQVNDAIADPLAVPDYVRASVKHLTTQRDELLAALKHIESHGHKLSFDAVLYARAALSKHQPTAAPAATNT